MTRRRHAASLLMVLAVALVVAACGRKGDLKPPPGEENSDYPRAYPSASP